MAYQGLPRRILPHQASSSLAYSIAAYAPVEAPPQESLLEPSNFIGSSPMATVNPPVTSRSDYRSGVVSSANRMRGDRELYSRGVQRNSLMRMVATGQVERSIFQPLSGWTWTGSFNDELYRAGGYPQNLGLTFKAPSVPDGVATNPAWGRMRPAPQITRTIFTRRRFSGAAAVPAVPQAR